MNTLTQFQGNSKGDTMGSEVRENATHRGGKGYIAPREKGYGENYDDIFRKPTDSGEEDGD
jgi:hypothetical protein